MRGMSLLLGLVLAWSLTWMALADSFDPLRRADDEETAQLSWAIAAAYYPQGMEGAGFDEYGEYFTFVRFSGERRLSLSASWSFNRCHKLGMSLVERTTTLRERRWFATDEWEAISVVTGLAYHEFASLTSSLRLSDSQPPLAASSTRSCWRAWWSWYTDPNAPSTGSTCR